MQDRCIYKMADVQETKFFPNLFRQMNIISVNKYTWNCLHLCAEQHQYCAILALTLSFCCSGFVSCAKECG